jgi:hypothetical protein
MVAKEFVPIGDRIFRTTYSDPRPSAEQAEAPKPDASEVSRRDSLRELQDEILAMSVCGAISYEAVTRPGQVEFRESVHRLGGHEWSHIAATLLRMIAESADAMTWMIDPDDPSARTASRPDGAVP